MRPFRTYYLHIVLTLLYAYVAGGWILTSWQSELRKNIQKTSSLVAVALTCGNFQLAQASMLTFPLPSDLKNSIVLVRSGESFADARHEIQTNPAKKLRQDNALTDKGRQQAVEAAKTLEAWNLSPTFIWVSNTERAYETAAIIARECQLGQNRIVPEFSFLDARAVGSFEGGEDSKSWEEIHRNDASIGVSYRPPPTSDGTPSESVQDVLVRMNQLVSTIESMYSNENVVIVSPDSELLSVLEAASHNEDPDSTLPNHAQFAFRNGEVRVFKPFVKVSTLLSTGQTPEEADKALRKMRAVRVAGMTGNAPSGASRDFDWMDLWKSSVDYALDQP